MDCSKLDLKNELRLIGNIKEPQEMDVGARDKDNDNIKNLVVNNISTIKTQWRSKKDKELLEMLPKVPSYYSREDTNLAWNQYWK